MAVIRSLTEIAGTGKKQPTEVDATWSVVQADGKTLFHLSTYGSDNRVDATKMSQTIQIDKSIALQLQAALKKTFGLAD